MSFLALFALREQKYRSDFSRYAVVAIRLPVHVAAHSSMRLKYVALPRSFISSIFPALTNFTNLARHWLYDILKLSAISSIVKVPSGLGLGRLDTSSMSFRSNSHRSAGGSGLIRVGRFLPEGVCRFLFALGKLSYLAFWLDSLLRSGCRRCAA